MTCKEDCMHIPKNETGAVSIKILVVVAILFLIIHIGYKLIPMYMDFERMKDEMAIKASVAQVLKDEEIRADLVKKAKELELPLGGENFMLKRDEGRQTLTISTAWDVEVHFLFNSYVRTFRFAPVVEENYAKGRR
jgi:hypothetical protein